MAKKTIQNIRSNAEFNQLLIVSLVVLSFNQFFMLKITDEVTRRHDSAGLLSQLMSLMALSRIVALPISGYLGDKFGEKSIIFAGNVLLVLFSVSLWFTEFSRDTLNISVVIIGLLMGLISPPSYALIPRVIRSLPLFKANSRFQTLNQIGQFAVPGLAGALIVFLTTKNYVLLMIFFAIISMLVSLILFRSGNQSHKQQPSENHPAAPWGYWAILKNRQTVMLLLLTLTLNLGIIGPQQIGLPIFVSEVMQRDTRFLGLLMTFFGAGAFLGSFLIGYVSSSFFNVRRLMFLTLSFGIGWAIFPAAGNFFLLASLLFACGILVGCINVIYLTLLQAMTLSRLLGKTMSLQFLFSAGLQPLSYLLTGQIIEQTTVHFSFWFFGALIAVISVLFLFIHKSIEKTK